MNDVPSPAPDEFPSSSPDLLDLNEASAYDLHTKVAGINEVLADRIVAHRTQSGPFRSVWELAHVPGIGHRLLDRITDQVTVSRPSSASGEFLSPAPSVREPVSTSALTTASAGNGRIGARLSQEIAHERVSQAVECAVRLSGRPPQSLRVHNAFTHGNTERPAAPRVSSRPSPPLLSIHPSAPVLSLPPAPRILSLPPARDLELAPHKHVSLCPTEWVEDAESVAPPPMPPLPQTAASSPSTIATPATAPIHAVLGPSALPRTRANSFALGAVLGALITLGVGTAWFFTQGLSARLHDAQAQTQSEVARLQARIDEINARTQEVQSSAKRIDYQELDMHEVQASVKELEEDIAELRKPRPRAVSSSTPAPRSSVPIQR